MFKSNTCYVSYFIRSYYTCLIVVHSDLSSKKKAYDYNLNVNICYSVSVKLKYNKILEHASVLRPNLQARSNVPAIHQELLIISFGSDSLLNSWFDQALYKSNKPRTPKFNQGRIELNCTSDCANFY